MKYQNILLATDLEGDYVSVAERAQALAESCAAKLSIVHVVEPIPTYAYSLYSNVDLETKLIEEAKRPLAELGEKLAVSVDDQHTLMGSPKHEVLTLVETLQCDLLVVGSHSRSGLAFLLGSTASGLAQAVPCDVLTVHHRDEE